MEDPAAKRASLTVMNLEAGHIGFCAIRKSGLKKLPATLQEKLGKDRGRFLSEGKKVSIGGGKKGPIFRNLVLGVGTTNSVRLDQKNIWCAKMNSPDDGQMSVEKKKRMAEKEHEEPRETWWGGRAYWTLNRTIWI